MKRLYILLTTLVLVTTASAQSHWTVAVGQDNAFLYGQQNTYLGGFRMGFDYRYDFRNGKGVGIETGAYFRYVARRYDHDILGLYATSDDVRDPVVPGHLVEHTFLYSSATSAGYFIPVNLTYTHFFYRDWSITPFAGFTLNMEMPQRATRYEQVLLANGNTHKSGTGQSDYMFNITIDAGLGFTYRHFQFKAGINIFPERIYSDLRFDGTIPTQEEMQAGPLTYQRYYSIADLFITFGYRIK